jgi:hypothetical protein
MRPSLVCMGEGGKQDYLMLGFAQGSLRTISEDPLLYAGEGGHVRQPDVGLAQGSLRTISGDPLFYGGGGSGLFY